MKVARAAIKGAWPVPATAGRNPQVHQPEPSEAKAEEIAERSIRHQLPAILPQQGWQLGDCPAFTTDVDEL
jgi:hypothetical protein